MSTNFDKKIQRKKRLTDSSIYLIIKPMMTKNEPIYERKYLLYLHEWITGFALLAGFLLSIVAWLEICIEHCSATENYRFMGMPFGVVGVFFFLLLMNLLFFSRESQFLSKVLGWLLAMGLGAEAMFVLIQKYQIGHWCPVCLSIALTMLIASIAYSSKYHYNVYEVLFNRNRGEPMKLFKTTLTTLSFAAIGFLSAFIGVTKISPAHAAVGEIKDQIVLGQKNSPIEIFFVSDWYCPSCKKIEPLIEKILPQIQSKVAFYFIDYAIHTKSQNFSPYNLSFLINNKKEYFKARSILYNLAEKNDSPTESDIEKAAKEADISFKELPFLSVKSGLEYFDKIIKQYDLSATPTMIIVNSKTDKNQKLEGSNEITEANIFKAIYDLSK